MGEFNIGIILDFHIGFDSGRTLFCTAKKKKKKQMKKIHFTIPLLIKYSI